MKNAPETSPGHFDFPSNAVISGEPECEPQPDGFPRAVVAGNRFGFAVTNRSDTIFADAQGIGQACGNCFSAALGQEAVVFSLANAVTVTGNFHGGFRVFEHEVGDTANLIVEGIADD